MATLRETNDFENKAKSIKNCSLSPSEVLQRNEVIYLCSRHVPHFAVLEGQDLLEEHFK